MDSNATSSVKVLAKAIQILNCFTISSPTHTVTSLSEKLEMPKTTVHRILSTLQEYDYIEHGKSTNTYKLGMGITRLSYMLINNIDFKQQIYPVLLELANNVGANVYLSVLNENEIIYIDEVFLDLPVSTKHTLGTQAPAYNSAMGQVMLSQYDRNQLLQILSKNNLNNSKFNVQEYIEIINSVKAQGYSVDMGNSIRDICGIAAPVRDCSGKIIAAFALSVPIMYANHEFLENAIPQAIAASNKASKILGYLN